MPPGIRLVPSCGFEHRSMQLGKWAQGLWLGLCEQLDLAAAALAKLMLLFFCQQPNGRPDTSHKAVHHMGLVANPTPDVIAGQLFGMGRPVGQLSLQIVPLKGLGLVLRPRLDLFPNLHPGRGAGLIKPLPQTQDSFVLQGHLPSDSKSTKVYQSSLVRIPSRITEINDWATTSGASSNVPSKKSINKRSMAPSTIKELNFDGIGRNNPCLWAASVS